MRHPCLIIRILFLTKTNKTLAIMQVDSRSGGYIFSQSRRAYWVAELLPLRIRERRETFGLSCAVSAICRARPARGSECTRSAYFCAKRATASISRGKPLQKSINREKSLQKYSCFSFATLAAWREKYPAAVALLIRPKASQRSQPLTRIISAAQ